MGNPILRLSPPWRTYYNKIKALFDADPDIKIEYNESNTSPEVTLYIEDSAKAEAIQQLLGVEKKFGTITLAITVVPANNPIDNQTDLLKTALRGNPIVNQIAVYDVFGGDMTFCEFKKEVIQFPNDDCSDLYGNYNGLAEDLAREIFVGAISPQINYCTAID